MKSKLSFFLFCLLLLLSNAGNSTILPIGLKQHADSTPKSLFKNHYALTEYLIKGTKNDEEKVLIFSYWIAKNIIYDKSGLVKLGRNKVPRELLSDRRGVCGCMSNLFQQFCDNSNVKCYTIYGKAYGSFFRRYFTFSRLSHAWNSVFINQEWKLVDVTWNTNLVKDSKFKKNPDLEWIFKDPTFFAKSHFPENPAWQLLKSPYSKKEFWKRNVPVDKEYNFRDTLAIMKDSSKSVALLSSIRNTYYFTGNKNKYVKSVIKLGWRVVFDAKDSSEAIVGVSLLEDLNKELQQDVFTKQKRRYSIPLNNTKEYIEKKWG